MNRDESALLNKIHGMLEVLLNNHLPHIEEDVKALRRWVWGLAGLLITLMGSGLIALAVYLLN